MKKRIGAAAAIAAAAAYKIADNARIAKSYSITGGADGPTAVFVAWKIGDVSVIGAAAVGVVLLVVSGILLCRGKR